MKKILCVVAAALALTSGMFAQVMNSKGLKNTLSTGFGDAPGYALDEKKNLVDYGDKVLYYGIVDQFQIRYDLQKFTVESMLKWGILNKYDGNDKWYLSFDYLGSYVNFFVSPLDGLDIGAGTRLNWKVGEAPNSGSSWMPTSHIIQGGLCNGIPGHTPVAGYAYYANRYSSRHEGGDAALGVRYAYKDLFQLGLTIPSNTNTKSFSFNAAFEINPIDWLSLSVAYAGIGTSTGDLYVGTSLFFKNLSFDIYVAGNFRGKKDDLIGENNAPTKNVTQDLVGWGFASTISIPAINMTLRPEVGFTDYMHPDYTFAWYLGNRLDFTIGDVFNFGLWISYAAGAQDKYWSNSPVTKNYNGGQIFNISPDLTFKINNRHSLNLVFDYTNLRNYKNETKDDWKVDIAWTYVY